jgi:hypothetical protein
MFDNFDVINLIPKHICLLCIMLSTQMEINDVFKFDPGFCTNSSNYLHGFVVIF